MLVGASAENTPNLPGIILRSEPPVRSPRAILYRGRDRAHRCDVVVKVQRATGDPVLISRFDREGAALLRLRHPSIVTLYAFHPGNAAKNDPAALVLEYVPGTTLAAWVAEDGFLPPERVVPIVAAIAAALDCVHALGVVHRDIKPSSVLLPPRGPAKLTDFGAARMDDALPLTVMGDILGCAEYSSPEQVHGAEAADARSDVYSLAAVAYFALTGTPPFRAADSSTQSQLSVMHRQVFSSPPPLRLHRPGLSPAIEEAVLRGLAKAPDARYASAGQLAAALQAALAASSGEPQQKAIDASARRSGVLAGGAAAAVLLAGFALWAGSGGAFRPPVTVPAATDSPTRPAKPLPLKREARAAFSLIRAGSTQAPAQAAPIAARQKMSRAAFPPKTLPLSKLPQVATVPLVPRLPSLNSAKITVKNKAASAVTRAGWYAVSGWLTLPRPSSQPRQSSQKPELVRASPLRLEVDGHPLPALASGRWTILPVGQHRVTFQPAEGLGAGPKTWTIKIAPSAHLSQQVSLPHVPLPTTPTHLRNP